MLSLVPGVTATGQNPTCVQNPSQLTAAAVVPLVAVTIAALLPLEKRTTPQPGRSAPRQQWARHVANRRRPYASYQSPATPTPNAAPSPQYTPETPAADEYEEEKEEVKKDVRNEDVKKDVRTPEDGRSKATEGWFDKRNLLRKVAADNQARLAAGAPVAPTPRGGLGGSLLGSLNPFKLQEGQGGHTEVVWRVEGTPTRAAAADAEPGSQRRTAAELNWPPATNTTAELDAGQTQSSPAGWWLTTNGTAELDPTPKATWSELKGDMAQVSPLNAASIW
jgi:hypothetical protein